MKKILVVDDDSGIVESLKEILELEDYNVDTAISAGDALQLIQENFYHLCLFDIKLPDMDGTDLLIEAQKIRPGMKKIMVTGYASLENSVKSLNAGADAYILKPIDPEKLLQIVREKLNELDNETDLDSEKIAEYLEEKLLGLRR